MKRTLLSVSLCLLTLVAYAQPKIVAHRGFWKAPGCAQNSLAALRAADALGCWGSELDVWISKDGVVMVNHDPAYKGKTLETSNYRDLKDLELSNGEKMPSLKEYLEVAKKCKCQLVLEIKTHQDKLRENACVDEVLRLVREAGLEKRTDYISFSANACRRVVHYAPKGTAVYYLSASRSPEEVKEMGCAGCDYEQNVFINRNPEWLEGFKQVGLKVNVWTVDSKENLQFCIDKKVDFITTNVPDVLKEMLKKK